LKEPQELLLVLAGAVTFRRSALKTNTKITNPISFKRNISRTDFFKQPCFVLKEAVFGELQ
jgi:hypothetical protein